MRSRSKASKKKLKLDAHSRRYLALSCHLAWGMSDSSPGDANHPNRTTTRTTSTVKSKTILFIQAFVVAVGIVLSLYHKQVLSQKEANISNFLLIIRSSIVIFVSFGVYIYFFVKKNIDETYTSYKSGVEYGLSNVEKSISRKDAKYTLRSMFVGIALVVALHIVLEEIWPCFFGPIIVILCILSNSDYVDSLTRGYIRKLPRSPSGKLCIPRSTSGRLM